MDVHGAFGISHSGPMHPSSPPTLDCDETLLKNTKSLPSPKPVTHKWRSESTTPNASA
ncbi:LEAF RUST 10 DISEASE-RESISTANCE LOCUS RECEPTOR-LIKE PROTEIN KINASE-like 1.1 [Senna tora]|uniref:LEAF RUST 10 DISEASE-RESISTANCE LOCUS RECEPTOR-LIKE PROTEIN KINASE-like 1.1 n=1 Tax=Senna tora TaxID=362788 RepID=A0A834TWF9_9FABA|nr:LEAF RUST 10 DISEASE-RESISTANCE LOCUS RECEPTOR-LIKE PROTEIN KINASE-like 1.1 [Senna tora]